MKWIKRFLNWSRNEFRERNAGPQEDEDMGGESVMELTAYLQRLQNNKIVNKKWPESSTRIALSQQLGRGGFANVYLGYYQGRRVAVKRLQTLVNDFNEDHLQEIVILRSITHPNIPTYYGSFVNESRQIYLVMEVVDGFPLTKLCNPNNHEAMAVSVTDKLYLSWQLWCALAYLHSKQIYHIDIKPDNIMVSWDMTAKLVDFGLSRYEDNIAVSRSCTGNGTWIYWAPEKPIDGRENPGKADTWSLGLSLCEAYAMQYPFQIGGTIKPSRVEHQFKFYQILNERPDLSSLPFWKAIPNESMRVLVSLALVWDYNKRPDSRSMEKHAYEHLRKNLCLNTIDSIEGVPLHFHRRFTIRTLRRRHDELVPPSPNDPCGSQTFFEWDCYDGPLGGEVACSSHYYDAAENGHSPLGGLRARMVPDPLPQAISSDNLVGDLEMDGATTGCCGIKKSRKKKLKNSRRQK